MEEARQFWTVLGCDVFPDACAAARERGLDVACGDFLESPLEEGSFDVVALWDTIEHLARPDLYLEKASRLLRKNGIVALTTGDIGSLMARARGRRWRLIHPPTHLFYFDQQTLAALLRKMGIEIIHVEHCGFHRSLQQMLYSTLVLGRKHPWNRKLARLLREPLNLSVYLNLYDIMMVVGRKR